MTTTRFEDTARALQPKLLAAAKKWLGNDPQAEQPDDVVQEALLRLWLWYAKRGAPQNPEAMALTMVKHLCIDNFRRNQRNVAEADRQTPDRQKPIDEAFMENETRQRLEQAMQQLPPNRRRMLYMRGQGMSIEEISAACNTTYTSTKTLISAARRQLLKLTNGGKSL